MSDGGCRSGGVPEAAAGPGRVRCAAERALPCPHQAVSHLGNDQEHERPGRREREIFKEDVRERECIPRILPENVEKHVNERNRHSEQSPKGG